MYFNISRFTVIYFTPLSHSVSKIKIIKLSIQHGGQTQGTHKLTITGTGVGAPENQYPP